jgi:hypothetical protein
MVSAAIGERLGQIHPEVSGFVTSYLADYKRMGYM